MPAESKLLVDLSSNNPAPSKRQLKKHWKAGRRILVLKVSEGTGYAWGDSPRLAKIWHKLGGTVGHYHWLTPGDTASAHAQANFFWAHVRADLVDGDIGICDFEQSGAGAAELGAFWDRINELLDARGVKVNLWTYSGAYFIRSARAKPHGTEWWGAGYPSLPFTPTGWAAPVAHQYTSKAVAPGLSGTVDQSELLKPLTHQRPEHQPGKPKPWHAGPFRTRMLRRITQLMRAGHHPDADANALLVDLAKAAQSLKEGGK